MFTPGAELSGADDVSKRREGRETQKSSFRSGRVLLLGLPPHDDVIDLTSSAPESLARGVDTA